MPPRARIRDFLAAIFSHWLTAMSGPLSVPLAVAAFFVQGNLAKTLLAISAIVCFGAAAYLVWRRERQAVIVLRAQLDDRERRERIKAALEAALKNADGLFDRRIQNDHDAASLRTDFNEFVRSSRESLRSLLSGAELTALYSAIPGSAFKFNRAHNDDHNNHLVALQTISERLRGMITRYSS